MFNTDGVSEPAIGIAPKHLPVAPGDVAGSEGQWKARLISVAKSASANRWRIVSPRIRSRAHEAEHAARASAMMLEAFVAGSNGATRALIDQFTPIIRARALRAVLRRRKRGGIQFDAKQDVEELTQEVLLVLFADRGRVLRAWDPTRGLALHNYVGMVAEREIHDILLSGRRRPWNERQTVSEPTDAELGVDPGPESAIAARQLLSRLAEGLREQLSPKALLLFEMLLVEGRDVEDACTATGMSRDAVYAWRSRLPKIVRRIADTVSTG